MFFDLLSFTRVQLTYRGLGATLLEKMDPCFHSSLQLSVTPGLGVPGSALQAGIWSGCGLHRPHASYPNHHAFIYAVTLLCPGDTLSPQLPLMISAASSCLSSCHHLPVSWNKPSPPLGCFWPEFYHSNRTMLEHTGFRILIVILFWVAWTKNQRDAYWEFSLELVPWNNSEETKTGNDLNTNQGQVSELLTAGVGLSACWATM
jgi:hypothetical protein